MTPGKYVQAVADALQVQLSTRDSGTMADPAAREDLKRLAETADPDAVRAALELLRKRAPR